MAGRPEPDLGHADDRDTKGRMGMRSQAGAATWIKLGVAVGDQQAKVAHMWNGSSWPLTLTSSWRYPHAA